MLQRQKWALGPAVDTAVWVVDGDEDGGVMVLASSGVVSSLSSLQHAHVEVGLCIHCLFLTFTVCLTKIDDLASFLWMFSLLFKKRSFVVLFDRI